MFRSVYSAAEDPREQLVIAPHHPDRLRRPPARVSVVERERFLQSLVWNAFRTLELLPPAFWLRRLHARLAAEALTMAPQVVSIHLWRPLQLPPVLCLDGARADVVVDVVVETEHAVWALVAAGSSNDVFEVGDGESDLLSRLMDAGAWCAGSRRHYVGIIEMDGMSAGAVLRQRLSRSRVSGQLRSGVRDAPVPVAGVGAIRWTDIASILDECAQAGVLSRIERALASNARMWLDRVGVRPAMSVG